MVKVYRISKAFKKELMTSSHGLTAGVSVRLRRALPPKEDDISGSIHPRAYGSTLLTIQSLSKDARGFLETVIEVSPLHQIYLEESGNPEGIPVVHLHGGPGSFSRPSYRKFYNPDKYRIILFDQRGCGKSTPLGETKENTTQDLIADMEKIRTHLGIDKWIVSGGSWGSTLALAYAEKFPERVSALIVRGIYTARQSETDWIYKNGAQKFFPEIYEKFINYIPESERKNIISAYAKRVLGKDKKAAWEAARIASHLEEVLLGLKTYQKPLSSDDKFGEIDFAGTKIFFHYETHDSFLKEGEILEGAGALKNIPGVIIRGRYDMICPPATAWELHRAWPKAEFYFTFAGHHSKQKETIQKIIEYTDRFAGI